MPSVPSGTYSPGPGMARPPLAITLLPSFYGCAAPVLVTRDARVSSIIGNLLGISGPNFDYGSFNNAPVATFRLGNSPSVSDKAFFTGLVVDTTTGEIISGPPFTAAVPELPSLALFGISMLAFFGHYWQRKRLPARTRAEPAAPADPAGHTAGVGACCPLRRAEQSV